MMLVMLPFSLLSLAAVLAIMSIIGTWRQYASAWDAVDAEWRGGQPAPVRQVTGRVVSAGRIAAPLDQPEFRPRRVAVLPPHARHAAA